MIVPVPPLDGVKTTLISVVLNTVAEPIMGELGFVVTVFDVLDGRDIPPELVAVTVNVYIVFGDKPDTVIGEVVPVPVKPPELLVTV